VPERETLTFQFKEILDTKSKTELTRKLKRSVIYTQLFCGGKGIKFLFALDLTTDINTTIMNVNK
jgi:hypothetical protein